MQPRHELSEPRGEGQGRWAPFINIKRLNFIFSSMKIRISEWLDPIRFFLTGGVTVRSLSQLFVLVKQAVLSPSSPQCACQQRWDRHPALSPTNTVFMKIENSDRIYNIEFKIWGVKKENLTL